jgi:enoyl-CoA hydratase
MKVTALTEAIDEFSRAEDQTALVITGPDKKAFHPSVDPRGGRLVVEHDWIRRTGPLGFAAVDAGKPTIAAIDGLCCGGGIEIAAWCDYRIASRTAEFGDFTRHWSVPFRDTEAPDLARSSKLTYALFLLETGARINAEDAQRIGLVQELVEPGAALTRALELAQRICDNPRTTCEPSRN